jgi:hypothetical protein
VEIVYIPCPTNRLGLGLDLLPVSVSPGVFCFLHGSLDDGAVGGEWSLVVLERCAEHDAGVLCGGFGIDEVFSVAFFCVGTRFLRASIFASCARRIGRDAGFATKDMVAEGWRIVMSLQGGSVVCCYLVRLSLPSARMYGLVVFCSSCGFAAC